jgi:hypothetical protein
LNWSAADFPLQINDYSTETLTIDKDSSGALWATWVQESSVYVDSTVGGDAVVPASNDIIKRYRHADITLGTI